MALVSEFEERTLDFCRINFAILTLIPKEVNAKEMKSFRSISLGNCSVKIFSKATTNKISFIGDKLLSSCQTAFVKGHFILESVVTAHEVIHELNSAGKSRIVLKLDYEKAYDMNWGFLMEILTSRGFGNKWISWVYSTLRQSSFCVKLNDTNGPYFVGGEVLKQGDPLSQILFKLVADVFF